jgi:hypothetical protein
MFIESDLRGTFQRLFGIIRSDNPPEAPTLRENWLFYRYIVDDLGYGAAYLLLPGERNLGDSRIRSRSKDAIMAALTPGDRVFVRCGSLSHIAMVYKTEQNPPTIYFTDAAYEFWQKGQNACISSFKLVDGGNNRFLSAVAADELMTPLINTLRHYTRPRVRENNGCWSSSWVNASISGRNQRSGIVGIRS